MILELLETGKKYNKASREFSRLAKEITQQQNKVKAVLLADYNYNSETGMGHDDNFWYNCSFDFDKEEVTIYKEDFIRDYWVIKTIPFSELLNDEQTEVVKNLRKETGYGIMECKKALMESNWDYEDAITYLLERKRYRLTI